MNYEDFLDFIKPELEKKNVTLNLINSTGIDRGKTTGYFDSTIRELAVAVKYERAFSILAHEYCHFKQWVEKPAFWNRTMEGYVGFFDWLGTENPISSKILRWKNEVIRVEHDCDRMTIELIKKLKLEIDLKKYAQQSNAYISGYHLIATYRRWPKKRVYETDEVTEVFPKRQIPLKKMLGGEYLKGEMLTKLNKCF